MSREASSPDPVLPESDFQSRIKAAKLNAQAQLGGNQGRPEGLDGFAGDWKFDDLDFRDTQAGLQGVSKLLQEEEEWRRRIFGPAPASNPPATPKPTSTPLPVVPPPEAPRNIPLLNKLKGRLRFGLKIPKPFAKSGEKNLPDKPVESSNEALIVKDLEAQKSGTDKKIKNWILGQGAAALGAAGWGLGKGAKATEIAIVESGKLTWAGVVLAKNVLVSEKTAQITHKSGELLKTGFIHWAKNLDLRGKDRLWWMSFGAGAVWTAAFMTFGPQMSTPEWASFLEVLPGPAYRYINAGLRFTATHAALGAGWASLRLQERKLRAQYKWADLDRDLFARSNFERQRDRLFGKHAKARERIKTCIAGLSAGTTYASVLGVPAYSVMEETGLLDFSSQAVELFFEDVKNKASALWSGFKKVFIGDHVNWEVVHEHQIPTMDGTAQDALSSADQGVHTAAAPKAPAVPSKPGISVDSQGEPSLDQPAIGAGAGVGSTDSAPKPGTADVVSGSEADAQAAVDEFFKANREALSAQGGSKVHHQLELVNSQFEKISNDPQQVAAVQRLSKEGKERVLAAGRRILENSMEGKMHTAAEQLALEQKILTVDGIVTRAEELFKSDITKNTASYTITVHNDLVKQLTREALETDLVLAKGAAVAEHLGEIKGEMTDVFIQSHPELAGKVSRAAVSQALQESVQDLANHAYEKAIGSTPQSVEVIKGAGKKFFEEAYNTVGGHEEIDNWTEAKLEKLAAPVPPAAVAPPSDLPDLSGGGTLKEAAKQVFDNQQYGSTVDIASGSSASEIFAQHGMPLSYDPATDADILGAHIIANYDALLQMWDFLPEDFPIKDKQELINLIKQAKTGNREAYETLLKAMHWIPEKGQFKVLNKNLIGGIISGVLGKN